jgi:hypothetical protein
MPVFRTNQPQQHAYDADQKKVWEKFSDLDRAMQAASRQLMQLGRGTGATTTNVTQVIGGGSSSSPGTSGTVKYVGVSLPPEFVNTGGPITVSGIIDIGKVAQSANTFWGGPTGGTTATPTFRVLVSADIPTSYTPTYALTAGYAASAGTATGGGGSTGAIVQTAMTVAYTQVANGPAYTYPLFNLPSGAIVHGVKAKHSTAFGGGTMLGVTVSLGPTGNSTKYVSAFNVFQAVNGTAMTHSNLFTGEDHSTAVTINANFTGLGDNLSNMTAGSVTFWIYTSSAL